MLNETQIFMRKHETITSKKSQKCEIRNGTGAVTRSIKIGLKDQQQIRTKSISEKNSDFSGISRYVGTVRYLILKTQSFPSC